MPSTARRATGPEGNAAAGVMATCRAGGPSAGGQSWPHEYGSGTRLSAAARPARAGSADRGTGKWAWTGPCEGLRGKNKEPRPEGRGSLNIKGAATYSPTGSPRQYHRRRRA